VPDSIKLEIENVRRLVRAELFIAPSSRTVIIGRNNAGKTTILDMVARALWSLPSPFDDQHRPFHVGWYRRTGQTFQRPRVTVTLPTSALGDEVRNHIADGLTFELVGRHLETQVTRSANHDSKLVTISCVAHRGDASHRLLEPNSPPGGDAWSDAFLNAEPHMLDDQAWGEAFDRGFTGNQSASAIYSRNTPLSRAIDRLAHRVIYLPASRTPQFGACRTLEAFSQSNLHNVTALLLSLSTTDRARFEGIGTALCLLFPEVGQLSLATHPNGVVPEVSFNDGRVEHVGDLGFGFQSALHLLTVCSLCPPEAILLIDEPEKGLNLACQRDLGSVLEAIRPDIALVVATQSEALCRGFSSSTAVVLAEALPEGSAVSTLRIRESQADLRRLARAMGLDPIFLSEGGKIVYVEGISDELIFGRWMDIQFVGQSGRYQVVALGGCGKLGEEFVKPILVAYQPRVFVVLDSDRRSADEPKSPDIRRLAAWLGREGISHYVLEKREVENYVGAEKIAEAASLHPSALRSPPGHEDWYDIKAAFERAKGFRYDERHLTVSAFELLAPPQQRELFGSENEALRSALSEFLAR
jgi:ABC-type branched-subunit amino acid transport system ATPase component